VANSHQDTKVRKVSNYEP